MGKTILDDAVTALVPADKQSRVRKRAEAGARVALDLLATLVVKKPALRRVLAAVKFLLSPGNDNAVPIKLITKKIRTLKSRLEKATEDKEQEKLRRKLEGLYELLEADEDDDN